MTTLRSMQLSESKHCTVAVEKGVVFVVEEDGFQVRNILILLLYLVVEWRCGIIRRDHQFCEVQFLASSRVSLFHPHDLGSG